MPRNDNIVQHKIGEKWVSIFFSEKPDQGYIIKTRAHKKRPEEDITYNKENVGSLLKQLEQLKTPDNHLVIVRTHENTGGFSQNLCYFIHVSEKLIEQYANKRSLTFYPRKNGDYGIDYWEKTGLVKYYSIDKTYLSNSIQDEINSIHVDTQSVNDASGNTKPNPAWHRDELILALDLYFRHHPSSISNTHKEVIKLSSTLNTLPLHIEKNDVQRFRNSNGVYMEMCNFLRFDPSYTGKGLTAGGKLEEFIWNEFADDRTKLINAAELIKLNAEIYGVVLEFNENPPKPAINQFVKEQIQYGERELENSLNEMSDEQFASYINALDSNASIQVKEGFIKVRKYNKKLIDDLKERCNYSCQICGFNSAEEYAVAVVEAHHIEGFSLTQNNKPENILIVCPNHHRLIHKANGKFNRGQLQVTYANGRIEVLKIRSHLFVS